MISGAELGNKAERTRQAILDAAEQVFAEKGFAAARLADVADVVGIRRPSIAYYYRDKRELYGAVQDRVFNGLKTVFLDAARILAAPPERLDAVISAWVGYVGRRPAVAYMLMREIVETPGQRNAAMDRFVPDILAAVTGIIEEGCANGYFCRVDPVHFVLNIAGATCFFVTAGPAVAPDWPFDPRSEEQLASHLAESLRVARRLVGTKGRGLEPAST